MDLVKEIREVENYSNNAQIMLNALIVAQKAELAHQKNLLKVYASDFEAANKELIKDPENETLQKKVEEVGTILALTKETIAQYQMNLSEFGIFE